MLGTLYTDTLTLNSGVLIPQQSIGVPSEGIVLSIKNADGILGLGPVALTMGTLVNHPYRTIRTVIDNLLFQNAISQRVISYSFIPSSATEIPYGTITLGGIDPADHAGPITYT